MRVPQKSKPTIETTYFKLNNELNRPINGQLQLHKDAQAVKAYFLEHVNPNTVFFHSLEEKLDYLVEHDYIEEDFLKKYSFEFIKARFKQAYAYKFRFKSFMGAHKFYTQYALKTNDGQRYLERYEDRNVFNALYWANGDKKMAKALVDEFMTQRIQMATPTYMNAGRKRRGEFVSCFLIQLTDDMNSIGRGINSALQLSRIGGGVGILLSNLREASAPIKGIENSASGVVPVAKILEDSFSYSNQLGQRGGAGVVYLSVFHPDIVQFLSMKKENADEKIRVKTLSLGIIVPDKFYELVKNNEEMFLFSPYDVEREYGVPFSYVDITYAYEDMVNNDNIRKYKISARELENEISKLQQESGYPFIINIDTVNNTNPIEGTIVMSNLCSEIMQVQTPSVISNAQFYEEMGRDVSCNLASTNMVNMMDSPDFGKSVETAVRALTRVSDTSNVDAVPTIQHGNALSHSIGLGAMGLHTLLAKNHIHYGSDEALELVELYFYTMKYYALKTSMQISIERGVTFYGFEKSDYANGLALKPYTVEDIEITSDKVKDLFKNIRVPRAKDWLKLSENIQSYGLYNAYLMAIAPTGSISYINETSASLQPITQLVEERQEKKTGKTYYPTPYLSNDTMPYFKTAYNIDMRKVIDTYAVAQRHIDQGMSLTLFMPSEIPFGMYEWKLTNNKFTTRDLNILRNYAWQQGIKSLYYVRTYTEGNDSTGANVCESCSI